MNKSLILIVDDMPENIQIIGNILKKEKIYDLIFCSHGNKVLPIVMEKKPDLILLDIIMPDISGYDICRMMKSSEDSADIPVIFLTAKSEIEDIVQGFETGAVDYICKPLRKEELLARVRTHIRLRQTEAELREGNRELEIRLREEYETRRLHEQILVQKSKLESLGRISAGIAHEINQPLSGISMGIENILIKSMESRLRKDYLEKECGFLLEDIKKIRNIIEHVRTFSREQRFVKTEETDVNEVIRNALLMTQAQYEKYNIRMSVQLQEGLGYTLGNPYKLEQVVLNLLANARDAVEEKYSDPLCGNREIIIRSYKQDDNEMRHICLEVEDRGNGIPDEDRDIIFEPFYTTKTPDKGTGLGLSISYGIIKEMEGEILVQSRLGEYSRFTVLLPGGDSVQ